MKRLLVLIVVATVLFLPAALRTSTATAADPVDVTVTITRFVEIDDPDTGIFEQSHGEYYGIANIANQGYQDSRNLGYGEAHNAPDISPFWRFTATVDRSLGTIPIAIQVKDDDTGVPATTDDVMDISPVSGRRELQLTFNLNSGTWTGDTPANVGCAQGDGDSERGKVLFDISFGNGNLAGDGIPDGVKRFGVRDPDCNLVVDMAAMGADPCRKTVALQIDWMQGAADGHSHKPKAAAVAEAKAAFAASTVPVVSPCPYAGFPNGTGADLVVDVANAIPEAPIVGLGGDFDAIRNANFNPARRPFFHYVLFVHDQAAGTSSSGLCCSGNKDYLVSLGSWRQVCVGPGANGVLDTTPSGDDVISGTSIIGGPDRTCNSTAAGDDIQITPVGGGASDYEVGTVRDQSGSILHELGHSLGLGHGGSDGTNYKPNYLSVMNYAFDPGGIPDQTQSNFRLDYSRVALPSLDEKLLAEANGIGAPNSFTYWTDANGKSQSGAGNGPLDWSGNGAIDAGTVNVDLNNDGTCVSPGPNKVLDTTVAGDDVVRGTSIVNGPNHTCDTTAAGDDVQTTPVGTSEPTPLTGYDDWSNIKYRAALSVNAGGAAVNHGPDITFEEASKVQAFFAAFFHPDLKATKTVDKASATPGDTLTYTVKADNIGTGAATQVKIDDTKPDATVESRNVSGNIAAGGSKSETYTYVVPCLTSDLTVLTNSATVSGKNLLLNPEEDTSNNTSSASTTVHTPVLTLAKSATATANAGAPITYALTYENTGSGAANNVTVTDTLPASVYYSKALDLGAGPKPNTVTVNGDGSRTLVWNVGALPVSSGPKTILFTARATLLSLSGTSYTNIAKLDFQDLNGCQYPGLSKSASTTITVVPPSKNPREEDFWKEKPAFRTAEILARIQATDQRYDGRDGTAPDGALSAAEVAAMFRRDDEMPRELEIDLLATYFNLATRRINAGTLVKYDDSKKPPATVRDGVLVAINTLKLPFNHLTERFFERADEVLDRINDGH